MIGWEAAISILLTLGIFIGGAILQRLFVLEKKLDAKIDETAYWKHQSTCRDEFRDVWDAVKTHSHTGLAPDSKVTR